MLSSMKRDDASVSEMRAGFIDLTLPQSLPEPNPDFTDLPIPAITSCKFVYTIYNPPE
jgi:hypothetical protein